MPGPPPPGYGHPQAPPPPPPPGYGYPQAPQVPPGSGYGYPTGQPNPYAQQPGPYGAQQPGYGYPGQPTVPLHAQAAQPAGAGGRRGLNAQVAIIVAAVVAIALIIGGGVWYANSSGHDGRKDTAGSSGGTGGEDGEGSGGDSAGNGTEKVPDDPAARVLFQIPAPVVKDAQIDSVEGSWLTDTVYAKAGVNQIVGYEPDTGKARWTLPLTGQTCAASRQITADRTAVVLTEGAKRNSKGDHVPCTEITAFSLDTGKQLWTGNVELSGTKVVFGEVSISGSTVAVGGGYNGGAGFDVRTGKVLWQPKVGGCRDAGYAGGEQLVAVRKCGTYGSETLEVQLLDAATGSVKWTYKLPAGIDNAKVISTKPVVFGADSSDITASGATDVFSLDDGGKLRYKIALKDGEYAHRCEISRVDGCKGIVVGNGKLYVPTKEHDGSAQFSNTNEIVAFSLATGKTTGDRVDAGDRYTIFPIRMDGGDLIAFKDGPYDKGAQVVSVNGRTLKQTELLETPATRPVLDAISSMVPSSAELLYTGGRLFLGKELVSKPYSADEKRYTAIGFGTR
ncbi:outer membrane protein assembly factor BamB family protein [Streptomyces sp. NPDC003697]